MSFKDTLIDRIIAIWMPLGASNSAPEIQQRTGLDSPPLVAFLQRVPVRLLTDEQLGYLAALPLTNHRVAPPVATAYNWAAPQYSEGHLLTTETAGYLLGQSDTRLTAWVEYVVGVGA